MSQPLYFLPGVSREQLAGPEPFAVTLNRAILKERGIAGTFSDVPDSYCVAGESHETPSGKFGCLLYYQTPSLKKPAPEIYSPADQTWHKIDDGLYIGINNASPPTPEDLRRRKQYRGRSLELCDYEWTIPVMRRCVDGFTTLPTDMFLDIKGTLCKPVKRQYAEAYERFRQAADFVLGLVDRPDDAPPLVADDIDEVMYLGLAIEALGMNYRYGLHEHSVLRIIDSDTWMTVLSHAVDLYGAVQLREAQKKTSGCQSEESITSGFEG